MKTFNAVADMVAAILSPSQNTSCNKYYVDGDLVADLDYYVKTAAQAATDGDVVDEYVNHTLANGNIAVLINNGSININQAGAVGDGVTDNTNNINAAIDLIYSLGGGVVYVPKGFYITNNNVRIKDGVYLIGDGYDSHIRNESSTGFSKCTLITGNMGDPTNANSMFDETGYDFNPITRGEFQVTLTSAGDDVNFSVGDIIALQSFETWSSPAPHNKGKYLHQNEVTAISSGVINLRYAIPDDYSSSAGNRPTIHTLSGTINGYDGQPLFMAKNCGAKNLRITQTIGLSSGWYALFPCGINQTFENIWLDGCSTAVGSNNLSFSYFGNLQARFEAGWLDFAEFVNNITVENCIGNRIAANPVLNRIGISSSKGSDNTFINVKSFLSGWGRIGANQCHRTKFIDCDVYDSGSASDTTATEAILLGFGDDCEARNCKTFNHHKYGVQIVGERSRVTQCKIDSTNASYYGVYCPATLDVVYVHDNEFGREGSITTRDRFFQQTSQSENAEIYNNTGYVEHELKKGAVSDSGFASSNQVGSYEILKTTTLKGGTGVDRRFKITAKGVITGTTSTKLTRLMLGTDVLIQASFTASPAGAFSLESEILVSSADSARVSGIAIQENTILDQTLSVVAGALTSDKAVTFEAQVANAADSVSIYQFIVECI